jgi:PAS domain S-box-containing protein
MNTDDHIPLMLWRARPDMSCEYVNRAWLEFTGYSAEEALGGGWSRGLHPEDLARWLDTCVRAYDERKPFEIEYRLRRHDGDYHWVLDRAAPRYSGDGVFLGYTGACVDIDSHKREAHTLARALERERRLRLGAEEASRVREGLTVSVLRELQAPSQAMATWAAHLRGQVPDSSEAARALEAIERNARTQNRVISNLLDLGAAVGERAERPLLSGVRVLVVDGDREAREGLVKPLEVAGADVRAAASPAEALETLGSWRPDVLVSENDESFIRALRALPAERGGCLHTAAITKDGTTAVAGYDAHLAKPVEPVALLATVARLAA